MRVWLAIALAAAALFLSVWIYLPAPTYFLLNFSVGAPEVCQWIALTALVAMLLAGPSARQSGGTRVALTFGGVAFALAISPFARLASTERRFAASMQGRSVEPARPMRASPLSVVDLFRGIASGDARVTRGVVFAEPSGVRLTMDIYQPPTRGTFPVIVQIYGGAWQRGEPGDRANFASLLASRGWVVFAIDYRHAPAFQWPAALDDVHAALAWIREHAIQYDADTTRMVLMGRSAGAHLAMLAAYKEPRAAVRGVVSYYGPADLPDAYFHPPRPDPLDIRDVDVKFIGGSPEQKPREYADASPVSYADRAQPPTLLIQGARDNIVEARYARALRERLAAGGTNVAYLEIPWAGHAFDAVFNGTSSQLALYHTERFLTWAAR